MARKRTMTTQTRPQDKTTKLTQGLPERRYLPELHGVRGLALLGVVLFHLFGNGRISGGIDIFLAVSGFLFTGMLLREAANSNGRIDFFKYFGRLVRRIFVPLAIVAVVTLVAGLLISPVTQHRQLWAEARASLYILKTLSSLTLSWHMVLPVQRLHRFNTSGRCQSRASFICCGCLWPS